MNFAKYGIIISFLPVALIISIIFLILLLVSGVSGSNEMMIKQFFSIPFEEGTTYTITSKFGYREDPFKNKNEFNSNLTFDQYNPNNNNEDDFHSGIDVVPINSENVVATADGIVIKSGFNDISGEFITIEHTFAGASFRTTYGHLLEDSRLVVEGENVVKGQVLGIYGATGKVTGRHLHFSIQLYDVNKKDYEYLDPICLFE